MADRVIHVDDDGPGVIQAAIDALGGAGGTVLLPAGRFVIDQPVELDSRTTLAGAGPDTVLALASGARCHVVTNRRRRAEDIEVRDLVIDGNADHQVRPEDAPMVWAMGVYFRRCRGIRITDVAAHDIRQSAFHVHWCEGVTMHDVTAERVGWSGISTANSDDVVLRRVRIAHAGRDVRHSGIHLDGGSGAYVEASVTDCTGNAIMLDSKSSTLTDVVVKGSGRRSHRGLMLRGSHEHPLANVSATGEYTDNEGAGILISNSEHVFVVGAVVARNGEHGILLQGRSGAHHCVVADCVIADNPVPLAEIHNSSDNYVVEIERPR